MQKLCSSCRKEKDFSDFPDEKGKKDGKHSWCFLCKKNYQKLYHKKYTERMRQRKILIPLSKRCGKCRRNKDSSCFAKEPQRLDGLGSMCFKCKKLYGKSYYKKYHQKFLQYRRDYVQKNKENISRASKLSRKKLREEVFSAYGHQCNCCNVSYSEFLTVEHTLHNGKQHRRKTWDKVYQDLRRRGFPKNEGIVLLCWNCNMATRYGGVCPHKVSL